MDGQSGGCVYLDSAYIHGWPSVVHDDVTMLAPHWSVGSHHGPVLVVHGYMHMAGWGSVDPWPA